MLLVGGWVIGWFIQKPLYDLLMQMIERNIRIGAGPSVHFEEAFRNATEAFMLSLKLSFMIGLVLVFPFIVLQVWAFIAPGLKPSERKPFARLAPLSLLLFFIGAGFCWLVLPAAIRWFASFLTQFPGTGLIQEPGAMVFFVLKMMMAFGIGFQLPIAVYALGALNLLTAETLIKHWRQASIVIFIASAVITPSADAFSMLMMAVPLILLFMISVFAVKVTQRKRARADEYAD
jgi:sec-independent protein translocase protein TatC